MKFLVIGGAGNMGKRYCSILKYLNYKFDICDPMIGKPYHIYKMKDYTHVIVATPTDAHFYYLNILSEHSHLKVLCEKPFCKTLTEINSFLSIDPTLRQNLFMVNNYEYANKMAQEIFYRGREDKDTEYNFYNTGSDGVLFDCIQLLYLAEGNIKIQNSSPMWSCKINGRPLDRHQIDPSYVYMIRDFGAGRLIQWDIRKLIRIHKFIWEENERLKSTLFNNENFNWSSSSNDIKKISGESFTAFW